MAAIVRVKRRVEDEPAISLILSCKRLKLEHVDSSNGSTSEADIKSVFKFAGTVCNKHDKVVQPVRQAIRKEKLHNDYKLHNSYVVDDSRRRHQERCSRQRYSIVSQKRAVDLDKLDDDEVSLDAAAGGGEATSADTQRFRMFDVVPCDVKASAGSKVGAGSKVSFETEKRETITCNGQPMTRTSVTADAVRGDEVTAATDAQYVYDVYYMNKQAFEWSALENIVTVEAFHQDELEYVDDRANECEEVYDDEDDSNDEDNWRNDYPDEDPRFFENEDCEYRYGDDGTVMDDMERMFKHNLQINASDDYQSTAAVAAAAAAAAAAADDADSDDDEYYRPGLNPTDLWAPKTTYDKYKKQVKKEMGID